MTTYNTLKNLSNENANDTVNKYSNSMSGLEVLLGLGITANAMWIIQNARIAIFGKNGCKWCKKVSRK